MEEVKGGTHRPARPLRQQGGVAQQCRVQAPQHQALVVRVSGWGRQEDQGLGLTTPILSPLCCSSSSLGLVLLSAPTHRAAATQGHILPPDSGSWFDGPQAWNKQREERGQVRVSGVGTPRINTCSSAHRPLPVPSQQPPCAPRCLGADGLVGQPLSDGGAPGRGFLRRAKSLNLLQCSETDGQGPPKCPTPSSLSPESLPSKYALNPSPSHGFHLPVLHRVSLPDPETASARPPCLLPAPPVSSPTAAKPIL